MRNELQIRIDWALIVSVSNFRGSYNTELTSGQFPSDAWVKASGYITLDAIRNSVFMDTLSNIQSIALCAYDLAQGYQAKTGDNSDDLIITCCDLVLKYHLTNTNAMILKAETLLKRYHEQIEQGPHSQARETYLEIQNLYKTALKLGYREMPPEMYRAWLFSISEQREKYNNKEISEIIK